MPTSTPPSRCILDPTESPPPRPGRIHRRAGLGRTGRRRRLTGGVGPHRAIAAPGRDAAGPWAQRARRGRPGSVDDCRLDSDDLLLHLPHPYGAVDAAGQLTPRSDTGLAGRPLHRHQPQPGPQRWPRPTRPAIEQPLGLPRRPDSWSPTGCGRVRLFRNTTTLTAKLFHDPRYPSTLASDLPTRSTPPK